MQQWRRTRVIAGIILLCFFAQASAAPDSLRDVAGRAEMLIGAAVRPAQLSEPAYAETLAREFNLLEPEDALKWEALRPSPQAFDFAAADQIVDFAQRHNMKVRGHTLVWHRQIPSWLANGTFTPEQLSGLLETHIRTVVAHFRGKIFAWDVVNEAFDEPGRGELRHTLWYDHPGIGLAGKQTAYIERCFRWVHEADPQALLFYNEGDNAETISPKSDAIYAMAQDFLRRGVPINGVGLQMHISEPLPDFASIAANIARFTALGLQVHITEMDVSLQVDAGGNASDEELRKQAEIYAQIAKVCLSQRGCTAIQTWGFTDKYSWIGSHSKKTRGAPLLFDSNYRPKPAYTALRDTLSRGR